MEGVEVAWCQVRGLWPTTRKMMLRTILMKDRWLVTPKANLRDPVAVGHGAAGHVAPLQDHVEGERVRQFGH